MTSLTGSKASRGNLGACDPLVLGLFAGTWSVGSLGV